MTQSALFLHKDRTSCSRDDCNFVNGCRQSLKDIVLRKRKHGFLWMHKLNLIPCHNVSCIHVYWNLKVKIYFIGFMFLLNLRKRIMQMSVCKVYYIYYGKRFGKWKSLVLVKQSFNCTYQIVTNLLKPGFRKNHLRIVFLSMEWKCTYIKPVFKKLTSKLDFFN